MNRSLLLTLATLVQCLASSARAQSDLELLKREFLDLKQRVAALENDNLRLRKQIDVERLVVRRELIVSDTGNPWEAGFEKHQIARGLYARPPVDGAGGLWVRSRLIKGEIDDPFDDRFHAIEHDGRPFRAPGHISWNVWIGDAWRQMAILQGESLEPSEMPVDQWTGSNHPGRLRIQTFRPHHQEPLTDVVIGQGMMSVGGGGFGGGGLPYPTEVLHLWGGRAIEVALSRPDPPVVLSHDGSGARVYSLIAIGAQGHRSAPSPTTRAAGRARLRWDSVAGADAYLVVRDGREITGPIRIEGSQKEWQDKTPP